MIPSFILFFYEEKYSSQIYEINPYNSKKTKKKQSIYKSCLSTNCNMFLIKLSIV